MTFAFSWPPLQARWQTCCVESSRNVARLLVVRAPAMVPVLYLGLLLWTERPLLLGLLMFDTLSVVVEQDRPSRWLKKMEEIV